MKTFIPVVLKFGLLIISIMLLIELSHYSLIVRQTKSEWIVGLTALLLIFTGVYFGKMLFKTKKTPLHLDKNKIKSLGISQREMDVLEKMVMGRSNKEIANELFISESTVKSHVSKLLVKLNAKRRTEAINTALRYKLISDFSTKK